MASYPEDARSTPATKITSLGKIRTADLQYESFVALFPDGSQRFLCIVGTAEGPRVDWDTYARYNTATWAQIEAAEVSEATIRILPQVSDYYTKHFHDRDQWMAFTLTSPDLDLPLYGYVKKGTHLEEKSLAAIKSGARRATIKIAITPEDIASRQVEITDVVTLGWVIDQ